MATVSQRRAANIRERRRMFNLNEAFDRLRTKVMKLNASGASFIGTIKQSKNISFKLS